MGGVGNVFYCSRGYVSCFGQNRYEDKYDGGHGDGNEAEQFEEPTEGKENGEGS